MWGISLKPEQNGDLMYIKEVKLVETREVRQPSFPYAKPTDFYRLPESSPASAAMADKVSLLRLTTDEGVQGYVETSHQVAKVALELSPYVVGLKVSQTSKATDLLYRLTLPVGRAGIYVHAVSALELLMWDALCKEVGMPCYSLLGGPSREEARAYASHLHPRPIDELRREARDYVSQGFTAMKMRFPSGPWDPLGVERNESLVKAVKEEVGYSIELAADCWMSWNLNFAMKMARKLERYELAWIEEPLLPDDLKGYTKLSKEGVPVAAGEHHYHVYDFLRLLEAGVRILQPDALWSGGITTMKKVIALAEAYGAWVIPHTSNVYNLHVVFSESENVMPLVEYLPHYRWMQNFSLNPQRPKNGRFTLPQGKGFCVEYEKFT